MSKHALVFALVLVSSATAAAQQRDELPSYDVSNALHVAAAIAGPLGGVGLVGGMLESIRASFGGGGSEAETMALTMYVLGALLLTAGFGLGIAASVVHSNTRNRREGYSLLPLFWADPGGAGAGLALRL